MLWMREPVLTLNRILVNDNQHIIVLPVFRNAANNRESSEKSCDGAVSGVSMTIPTKLKARQSKGDTNKCLKTSLFRTAFFEND
ncbi:hypothetical protein EGR_10669 [Echinococcus granulosus]|uniref:Uncharacterized protein n=1 Tax=Echinococcus granulosus TaxID=6210 RepID=W6U067_ECHGR|nr:hypothetical protein EGR_10669 [Echinococcus granulosus]EUB54470.1 hypothetical protein EGR_10669 [Echinococcus granulosus]